MNKINVYSSQVYYLREIPNLCTVHTDLKQKIIENKHHFQFLIQMDNTLKINMKIIHFLPGVTLKSFSLWLFQCSSAKIVQ